MFFFYALWENKEIIFSCGGECASYLVEWRFVRKTEIVRSGASVYWALGMRGKETDMTVDCIP